MDIEKTKQLVESIKTLNINFNDATTQKIADALLPVVKMYLFRDILNMLLVSGIFILFFVLAYKLFSRMIETSREQGLKEIEYKNKELDYENKEVS